MSKKSTESLSQKELNIIKIAILKEAERTPDGAYRTELDVIYHNIRAIMKSRNI